jgi:PmbA protein
VNTLALAERAVAGAQGDALAHVAHERSLTLRFANNRPTQATAVDDVTLELAVAREGHVGRASTNDTSEEALRECARRAEAAAEAAVATSPPGAHPGFTTAGASVRGDPAAARRHRGHDPATAALDPAAGGAALRAAFAAAEPRGLAAHGMWTAAEEQRAVATTAGGAVLDRTTDAFMKVICIAPGGRSGYASRTAVAAGSLEPELLAERAATKALAGGDPVELAPGEYPVVMEANAVGWLLDLLGVTAFNGLAHAEERGALAGRLGDLVAAPSINLADSPRSTATLPRAFDAEGTPKLPLPLIQDGVARAVVHDRRSAALAGTKSTGHATAPGGDPFGPHPVNLVLAGGAASGLDELCAPVERGVYVTRLWYANVVRPKETLITAVTRDGTFLIEDGRVTRPLRDLRLTDSVLGILSRVTALSAGQELTSDGELYGRRFAYGVVCPALRASAVRFTGAAG